MRCGRAKLFAQGELLCSHKYGVVNKYVATGIRSRDSLFMERQEIKTLVAYLPHSYIQNYKYLLIAFFEELLIFLLVVCFRLLQS